MLQELSRVRGSRGEQGRGTSVEKERWCAETRAEIRQSMEKGRHKDVVDVQLNGEATDEK